MCPNLQNWECVTLHGKKKDFAGMIALRLLIRKIILNYLDELNIITNVLIRGWAEVSETKRRRDEGKRGGRDRQ